MEEKFKQEEIFTQILKAGRRKYFFDVRVTKANDYYLTISESKKFTNEDGSFHYQKNKIYLYKEDFANFQECLARATEFILKEKGSKVITNSNQNMQEKDSNKPVE